MVSLFRHRNSGTRWQLVTCSMTLRRLEYEASPPGWKGTSKPSSDLVTLSLHSSFANIAIDWSPGSIVHFDFLSTFTFVFRIIIFECVVSFVPSPYLPSICDMLPLHQLFRIPKGLERCAWAVWKVYCTVDVTPLNLSLDPVSLSSDGRNIQEAAYRGYGMQLMHFEARSYVRLRNSTGPFS